MATGLCVVEGRSTKLGRSSRDADRDDDPPNDGIAADEGDDSHDAGRNFGRVVVDGCCNALAKALSTVPDALCCFRVDFHSFTRLQIRAILRRSFL